MPESIQQKLSILEKRVGPNSRSPLFAQLASYYLLAGRAHDALRVCDEGIANFPFYTTGHLIKAKVLIALNMNAEARRELEIVREFLPTNATIRKFLADIPAAASDITPVEGRTVKPKAKAVEAPPASVEPPVVETAPASETAAQEPAPETPPSSSAEIFGLTPTEPAVSTELETPPAAEPTGAFEAAGQAPAEPLGMETAAPSTEAVAESMPASVEPASPFTGFEATPPAEAPPAEQVFPSAVPPIEEETFEQYAARKRGELAGLENTMTLEEYLGGSSPTLSQAIEPEPPKPAEAPNEIEELAQKLQGAKKITPVINLSDKSPVTASEADTPASTGFVTPTLAEIYAKQGWYDDAIKAYRTLAVNKPAEREKFEKRIAELEELKKQKG